mgnify:FL=1
MKKRLLAILMAATMSLSLLAGCGSTASDESIEDSSSTGETGTGQEEDTTSESLRTEYPLTLDIYDADGNVVSVTFESAPERIVSTQLSITELLLDLGLEDKIVGILDPESDVDEELAERLSSLNSLGPKTTISKEAVIALDPDIVMGKSTRMFTDNAVGTVESYLDLGIGVYTQLSSVDVIDQSLENILQDIRNIGIIFDVQEEANAYADSLEEQLNATLERVSTEAEGKEALTAILMTGYQDGTFVAYVSDLSSILLETVGMTNVLESGGSGLTLENLISLNPDVIIYVDDENDELNSLLAEDAIQDVSAVANGRVLEIAYIDVMEYGARIISTLDVFADFLYGE